MSVKEEFEESTNLYCRVCFKIFNLYDGRHEIAGEIMNTIRKLLFNINFTGSKFMCSRCLTMITNFEEFKETVQKLQNCFNKLVLSNQHNNIKEIQKLSKTAEDDHKLENEDNQIFIKEEPMENLIIQNVTSMTCEDNHEEIEEKIKSKQFKRTYVVEAKKYGKLKEVTIVRPDDSRL
jgi:hypothetical protein